MDLSRSKYITFQSTVTAATTGVTNIYTFAPSVDNVFYDTNVADVITWTNAVLAAQWSNTVARTADIGAFQSMKLISIATTSNAGNATNVSASTGEKISSP